MRRKNISSNSNLLCLIIFLFFLAGIVPARGEGKIAVTPITTLSKIPSREITATYRDSEGYMWYAVKGMLCRDDGYDVISFPMPENSEATEICQDSQGRLMIATNAGCFVFSKDTYKVTPFDPARLGSTETNMLRITSDGSIWISTKGKLSKYDKDGTYINSYPIKDRYGNLTTLSGFEQARNGDIYITSFSKGILKYDKVNDGFKMYAPIDKNVSLGIIFQDHANDYFWVGDHNGMIYRFDPSKEGADRYRESLTDPVRDYINHTRRLRTMQQDSIQGYLWVTTRSGLVPLRADSEGDLHYVGNTILNEFDGAMVTSLYISGDKIWVFFYDIPGVIINLNGNSMENNRLEGVRMRYGDYPIITQVCPDVDKDLLWMIQMRSGLILYNRQSGEISDSDTPALVGRRLHQAREIEASPMLKGVWCSIFGSQKILGVSHDSDMNMQVKDSVSLARMIPENGIITKLYESPHGKLWIATTDGLFRYDIRNRKFDFKVKGLDNVKSFFKKGKTLWVVNDKGLYALEDGKKPVRVSQPGDYTAMTTAPDGKIWMGTKDGRLICYDPKSRTTVDYSADLSLNGNEIRQIYVDKFSHVWIFSDQVASQFNPRNKTHYDYSAGIKGRLNAYMSTGHLITEDEEIIVGGIGGLSIFTPSNHLDVDLNEPIAHVSDVRINGKSILHDYENFIEEDKLLLSPDSGKIEFFFSTFDQANSSGVRYAYRIKGLEKEWNYTAPGENRAFYNSIPKGDWSLEVKACDENNFWSEDSTVFKIKKEAAFYATWWAILIYIVVGLGILAFLLHTYLEHVNKENEKMWTDSEEMVKMREYLQSLVTLPQEEFRQLDRVLLDNATKVVEKNISVPEFGVLDLAKGVNMSKSSLARKLKAITGKTPLDFIRHIKMQYACSLLESQNYTIAEVAEMVGFEDRRYFTTSFKKEFGVTPSSYAKADRQSPASESAPTPEEEDDPEESQPE